ncbi:hypothetical protein BDV95DRAFT_579936 [Massariosphaeria phaeospora]|uniref:F-box domain-containing protein n=1 Tax=Massariosphaeria phaeospora TaxID=100035 RepID=A0A7C8MJ98_9PLEO|nr:hypothetical protein BDV95DRAFT_579936 [Massariosphaeria phaeospora]
MATSLWHLPIELRDRIYHFTLADSLFPRVTDDNENFFCISYGHHDLYDISKLYGAGARIPPGLRANKQLFLEARDQFQRAAQIVLQPHLADAPVPRPKKKKKPRRSTRHPQPPASPAPPKFRFLDLSGIQKFTRTAYAERYSIVGGENEPYHMEAAIDAASKIVISAEGRWAAIRDLTIAFHMRPSMHFDARYWDAARFLRIPGAQLQRVEFVIRQPTLSAAAYNQLSNMADTYAALQAVLEASAKLLTETWPGEGWDIRDWMQPLAPATRFAGYNWHVEVQRRQEPGVSRRVTHEGLGYWFGGIGPRLLFKRVEEERSGYVSFHCANNGQRVRVKDGVVHVLKSDGSESVLEPYA